MNASKSSKPSSVNRFQLIQFGTGFSVNTLNILVQVYDSKFEEWVDIDHSSVVTAKEKLKIVLDSVQEPTEVRIDEINGKR